MGSGCGASSSSARAVEEVANCTVDMPPSCTVDLPPPGDVDCLEDHLRWLRKTYKVEKTEKNWLMSTYERMEQDLSERHLVVAELRRKLDELQQPERSKADSASLNGTIIVSPAPQVSAMNHVAGTAEPEIPSPVPLEVPSNPASPCSGRGTPSALASGSLRSRRGLHIGGLITAKPAADVAVKPLAVVVKPLAVTPAADAPKPQAAVESKKIAFLQSLNSEPNRLIEPMTDKSYRMKTWGQRCTEPVSPLLSRRMLWDTPVSRAPSGQAMDKGLEVRPVKLLQMEELCPSSPKRIPTKKNLFTAPAFESIGEEKDGQSELP